MSVRKIAFPIYMLALAIVVSFGLAGYVFYQDLQHDRDIASLALERQRGVNQTLRSMCDRLELRDEIFLRILVDAARRQREAGNEDAAEGLELNILALQLAQGDCLNDIPRVFHPDLCCGGCVVCGWWCELETACARRGGRVRVRRPERACGGLADRRRCLAVPLRCEQADARV
jgi:hypothetical protein